MFEAIVYALCGWSAVARLHDCKVFGLTGERTGHWSQRDHDSDTCKECPQPSNASLLTTIVGAKD